MGRPEFHRGAARPSRRARERRRAVRILVRVAVATLPALAGIAAWPLPADAVAPQLAPAFGDHMVLQRDCPVPVWGSAPPGRPVTVALGARVRRTVAAADGRWSVRLPAMRAGGPHLLRAWCDDTLTLSDVMVGEVWLASGQSNMEMPLRGWARVLDADAEVAAAEHPDLRLLTVEHAVAFEPASSVRTSGWRRCTPEQAAGFSAVAYFFGRRLQRELGVPVGLVQATWGGTGIESWTRTAALARLPGTGDDLRALAARVAVGSPEARRQEFQRATAAWLAAGLARDRGATASPPWSSPRAGDGDWESLALPADWENLGLPDLDGVVWFRRHVRIPESWSGRDLVLGLGRIDDADTSYFDGVVVGTDSVYDRPREYTVPGRLVTPGEHVIAVRVYDWGGGGGLWGEATRMRLRPAGEGADGDGLALDGAWRYRVALDLSEEGPRPRDPDDPNQPGVLANGMLAPLAPFAIRGVLWYQGEANVSRAAQYRALFPGMIADWRAWWGRPELPFLFVQLAGFTDPPEEPGDSEWAELREAQAMARALPRTGMAVAIDVGEARDIHPRNKQEVGRRLALSALDVVHHRRVVSRGPGWRSVRREGASLRVRFDHTAGGLRARGGGEPAGFAIAGADRRFHWARARLEGDDVVLRCDAVPDPVAVRYAWAGLPPCGLEGGTGLPAEPFRTDTWPGITRDRR